MFSHVDALIALFLLTSSLHKTELPVEIDIFSHLHIGVKNDAGEPQAKSFCFGNSINFRPSPLR